MRGEEGEREGRGRAEGVRAEETARVAAGSAVRAGKGTAGLGEEGAEAAMSGPPREAGTAGTGRAEGERAIGRAREASRGGRAVEK